MILKKILKGVTKGINKWKEKVQIDNRVPRGLQYPSSESRRRSQNACDVTDTITAGWDLFALEMSSILRNHHGGRGRKGLVFLHSIILKSFTSLTTHNPPRRTRTDHYTLDAALCLHKHTPLSTSQPSWTRNQGPSPRFGACPCLSPREKTSRQHSQPETRAQDPKEENLEDQPTLVDEKSGAKPKIRLEGKNEQATFMAKDLVPNPEPVTTNFFVELEGVEEIIETEEAEEEGDAFQNDYISPPKTRKKKGKKGHSWVC
ncbi:uncharacterized protein LOC122267127 [Penaeus japonicus]|uniref:uncharacterized protein LOC122267127 n=1 Tax=Penaeus japonicus TaxID=27405 RepID=UPI001C710C3D|nr:uncharacterized protein LOC122267127 [Penaeus japonicus]